MSVKGSGVLPTVAANPMAPITPERAQEKGWTWHGTHYRRPDGSKVQTTLSHVCLRHPTPTAQTATGGISLSKIGGSGARRQLRRLYSDKQIYGSLNPDLYRWLMAWPIDWTALTPLATDKIRLWLQQHGDYLPQSGDAE